MSFTSQVKNELSKLKIDRLEAISGLSGIFRNSAVIDSVIKFSTENSSVARHVFNLIKEIYNVSCRITVRHGYNYNKNYIYLLEITNNVNNIIKDLCLEKIIPDNYIVDDDILVRAYLRGVFMASGSVNDPKKSRYHLEISVDDNEYADFIKKLMNKYGVNAKTLKRENRYTVYVKEAEKIGDFLRMINAINSLLYYEDIRIYRDHKNMTNRLNNCEQANVDKIIETAHKQIEDIKLIEAKATLDLLDDKTKEAATYRMKYKEASLLELSQIMTMETNNSITKSGLYHRFKKIEKMANQIREKLEK